MIDPLEGPVFWGMEFQDTVTKANVRIIRAPSDGATDPAQSVTANVYGIGETQVTVGEIKSERYRYIGDPCREIRENNG